MHYHNNVTLIASKLNIQLEKRILTGWFETARRMHEVSSLHSLTDIESKLPVLNCKSRKHLVFCDTDW